jgi:hypothetical protein
MTDMKKIVERRKHRRFQVQDGAYAALYNGSLKIGQIQNISKDGFALRYISYGEQAEGSSEVDIFASNNDFYLKNLPFKTISDVYIDFENPFSTTTLWQCGGQFGEITQSQMFQVYYFIQDYTISEA